MSIKNGKLVNSKLVIYPIERELDKTKYAGKAQIVCRVFELYFICLLYSILL